MSSAPLSTTFGLPGDEGLLRQPRGNHHRRDIDWSAVESDYRAGLLSLRELAQKHCCSHSAIANFAGRNAWTRDPRSGPRRGGKIDSGD